MPRISSLFVELSLEAKNFNNGIKDIEKQAKEFSKTVKPMVDAAENIGKTFTIAGAAVTAAFAGMVKSSADAGEQLNKFSIQTGITTEKLSALKYVAEQEETSFENLSKGLKTMSSNANLNSDAFKQLGIKVTDAHGQLRPMDSILLEVAQRMSTLQDGTTKNTVASEIFGGKLGQDLIPLLNRLGKEGLGPAQEMVRKLHLEMSGPQAKAADDFNDSIKEIEDSLLGLSNTVASALIPGLTDTSHSMRDAITATADFAKEHESLTKAVALTGLGLTGAGGLLLGLAGIVSIYPKVVIGLEAIAGGMSALSAEAVISTAGLAALAGWWFYLEKAEADKQRQSEALFETQAKSIRQIQDTAGALAKIGVVIEQGSDDWKTYAEHIRVAAQIHEADLPKMASGIHILNKAEEDLIKTEARWRAANADIYREQVENAQKFVYRWLEGFDVTSREADKYTSAIQRQEVATSKLGITSLDVMAVTGDAWEEANGKTFNSAQKLFNELNGLRHADMDENLEILEKVVKSEQKSADQAAQAWKNAMANLNTRIAESFADMIVKAKFNFSSLVNIAETTAKSMLSAFLSGLMNPLTSALGKLGQSLSGAISGSGGGKIGLPGIGGIGGGGTGNILGKGAGSIGVFGLSGAATLGIGAAALAVGLIAKHYIGKGRRTADEFTSGVQNQFGSDLAEVSAHGTTADLDTLWAQFNKDANQFASQGSTEQKVVDQAHQTLDALVAQVRRDVSAREAANVVINVTPAPNMDINNLASEILRLFQTDASARAQLQAILA